MKTCPHCNSTLVLRRSASDPHGQVAMCTNLDCPVLFPVQPHIQPAGLENTPLAEGWEEKEFS